MQVEASSLSLFQEYSLHSAAFNGQLNQIKCQLKLNPQVNQRSNKDFTFTINHEKFSEAPPLFLAAAGKTNNHIAIVKLLLEKGATPDMVVLNDPRTKQINQSFYLSPRSPLEIATLAEIKCLLTLGTIEFFFAKKDGEISQKNLKSRIIDAYDLSPDTCENYMKQLALTRKGFNHTFDETTAIKILDAYAIEKNSIQKCTIS